MSQRNGRVGRLLSPRHTLPPNTTCTYIFHGFPNDLIWLSFTSHHLQLLQPVTHDNLTAFGQVKGLKAKTFKSRRAFEFNLITERPASFAMDCENAIIRQSRYFKSQQIAINAFDYWHDVAATPAAAAAPERNEVETESKLLSRRGHKKSARL